MKALVDSSTLEAAPLQWHLQIKVKGRVLLPSAFRSAASLKEDDELVVRVVAPGVFLAETPEAIRSRIRENAAALSTGDAVIEVAEERSKDLLAEEKSWARRSKAFDDDDAVGEGLLAELGL